MIWNTAYNPYSSYQAKRPIAMAEMPDIEEPIEPLMKTGEIGQSVTEGGRFGTLIQTATAAIRGGTGKLELSTQMSGGGEAVGAGTYGKEARQALREMSRASGVEFISTHTPPQIGNLSGFNPQQGFNDEQRKTSIEELKKAIDFAADTAGGGAVVVHTGEFQRPISEATWAKNPDGSYRFVGFQEEPGRAITYMVDDRTGRLISEVRKSQVIREPMYKVADEDHVGEDLHGRQVTISKGDWVDQYGRYIDPTNPDDLFKRVPKWNEKEQRFETNKLGWKELEERTEWYNKKNPGKPALSTEEMAFRIQMETQMLQYRGQSLFSGRYYEEERKRAEALKKALTYYEKLEKEVPKDELWKIMQRDPVTRGLSQNFVPGEMRKPSEILKEELRQTEQTLQYTHESAASADAQAEAIHDTIEHVRPVGKYAVEQSMKSYAEAGIHAMQQSKLNPNVKKPIFVAPENLWPEMGYGSHPDEIIELVTKAREEMAKQLTSEKIEDPYRRYDKDGKLIMVDNPNYVQGMSKEKAAKEAEDHIKATLDTSHLGMWRAHFVPEPGESKQDTDKRFKKWYMEQIEELEKKKILGHIHLADSLSSGHHALPIGQGNLPLTDAIAYLKKKGYAGTIISEGYDEERFEDGRIMRKAWEALGSPVYSHFVGRFGPRHWSGMEHRWYGATYPPFYVFGAYAPSNDWVLWSEVPME
jgi:hypothetical protein